MKTAKRQHAVTPSVMAVPEIVTEPLDRQAHRRKPFSTWVKRLTSFKSSSDTDRPKRHMRMRRSPKLNNPYPQSGRVSDNHCRIANGPESQNHSNAESSQSFATALTSSVVSADDAIRASTEGLAPPTAGGRSMAGTVSTENEGRRSIMAPSNVTSSLAGTNRTVGGGMESRRGCDSTFSSPAPSVQSLTTTLTTIQSMIPNGHHAPQPTHSNAQSIHFSQPFPATSPASAIPAHLQPTAHPTTYTMATANNLLTDNASILTLASSSKRRRRRSMDTDASVRALAPSSLWGGSRESLPLSVLSANIEGSGNPTTPGLHSSGSRVGIAERSSLYSSTGVAPAIVSERNSVYVKQGDGASVRSGPLGYGRPDSVSGNATLSSPLASPREYLVDRSATVAEEKDEGDDTTARNE